VTTSGVYQPSLAGVVRGSEDPAGSHPTASANAERAGGELQRQVAKRVSECELVSIDRAGETENRELEGGIQSGTALQQLGISHAGDGIRRQKSAAQIQT
jgi:hypothetical protein